VEPPTGLARICCISCPPCRRIDRHDPSALPPLTQRPSALN
jgi:hypothetical protein